MITALTFIAYTCFTIAAIMVVLKVAEWVWMFIAWLIRRIPYWRKRLLSNKARRLGRGVKSTPLTITRWQRWRQRSYLKSQNKLWKTYTSTDWS